MKDGYAGESFKSFCGTGAKAYCVELNGVNRKAKGISKNLVNKDLNFLNYKQIVENGGSIYRKMKMYVFRSYLHIMYVSIKKYFQRLSSLRGLL